MSLGTQEQRTEGMKKQAQFLIDQAYQRGYKEGQNNALVVDSDKCIEQGRNMAWNAVCKILRMSEKEYSSLFATDCTNSYYRIGKLLSMSVSEAIKFVREYEQNKQKEAEEIHVGDVIRWNDVEAVVTWCDGKDWNGFLLKGKDVGEVGQVYSCMSCNGWKKTGHHFDEITEVLKKLCDVK